MKIAQIAPLAESVPPQLYGGTERIVSYLTEELVAQGHDVTLFASGDSITARGSSPMRRRRAPPESGGARPAAATTCCMLEQVRQRADDFDILHFHIDLLHFPLLRTIATPSVTTLHGRLDLPDLVPFYRAFPDVPLVSISDAQRAPMPPVHWAAHGPSRPAARPLPLQRARRGRLSRVPRPHLAGEAARPRHRDRDAAPGMPLKIAAKVDNADRAYWTRTIEPLVSDNPLVEFVGEIGEREKADFLGGATALLFPIDWPEPFGLVMIEAMACGTPVIAFACGSTPEVIDHGDHAASSSMTSTRRCAAVHLAAALGSRANSAPVFERRFSIERVAADYLQVYLSLCGMAKPAASPAGRITDDRLTEGGHEGREPIAPSELASAPHGLAAVLHPGDRLAAGAPAADA